MSMLVGWEEEERLALREQEGSMEAGKEAHLQNVLEVEEVVVLLTFELEMEV